MRKKLTAFFLSAIFVLQFGLVAFAENNDGLLKINSNEENTTDFSDNSGEYTNNEVLVLYKDGTVKTVSYSSKEEVGQAVENFRNDETVEVVQPNFKYENTAYSADDELFSKQWALNNDGSTLIREKTADYEPVMDLYGFGLYTKKNIKENIYNSKEGVDINIEPVWENFSDEGKRQAVIAVIDTGIDKNHEDLQDILWENQDEIPNNGIDDDGNGYVDDVYGYDFYNNTGNMTSTTDDNHGTHCAGTILANRDNSKGIAGIASGYNVKIMSLKALGGNNGEGTTESVIKAIKYAEDNGAVICNLSLCTEENDTALYKVMAKSKMLFVVAAGNDDKGTDNDSIPHYPAAYNIENMIAVANIRADGVIDPTSNYGKETVDIAAPGNRIISTTVNDTYSYMTGTSMAAPMVSAVCAMLYSYYDDINLKDVKETVLNSAEKLTSLNGKVSTEGMLNAYNAFTYDKSLLSHGEFEVPAEAYIEEEPTKFSFDIYKENGLSYLTVTATDVNNDIFALRFMKGNKTSADFKGGREGKGFTLNGDNECTFVVRSEGEYTFYALDKKGHETVSTVAIKF